MHREQPAERGELVGLAGGFQRDQHAHLAEPLDHRIVHVAADRALADRKLGGAPQRHVLADLGDRFGNVFGDGAAAGLGRLDLLDVGADVERDVGDHLHQALEQVVARDEVGLGIDLDHDALGALDGDADQAFGGDAVGLLGGLGQALLAQPIDRGIDVARGFAERGLAIHHARAGHLAQVLDHLCSDLSHCSNPLRAGACGAEQVRAAACSAVNYSAVSSLALATQPWTRPGKPDLFADVVGGVGAELGDLRIVEDAEVVELLLDRGRHAGELLEIVGDAARTGQRLEAETLFLRLRQILDDRLLGGAQIDAHAALRARNAVDRGARDQIAIERDGAAGVVIAGNHEGDAVGIAVGVDDRRRPARRGGALP